MHLMWGKCGQASDALTSLHATWLTDLCLMQGICTYSHATGRTRTCKHQSQLWSTPACRAEESGPALKTPYTKTTEAQHQISQVTCDNSILLIGLDNGVEAYMRILVDTYTYIIFCTLTRIDAIPCTY